MRKNKKAHFGPCFDPATYLGPRPGDFPLRSLQSRAAARAILMDYAEAQRRSVEGQLENLTPCEQALIEDVDKPEVRILTVQLYRIAKERARIYEMDFFLNTPEKIRYPRAVRKEIARMTDGAGSALENSNPTEWNRLKAIAEENLRLKAK
jgi:hypothetical protein